MATASQFRLKTHISDLVSFTFMHFSISRTKAFGFIMAGIIR